MSLTIHNDRIGKGDGGEGESAPWGGGGGFLVLHGLMFPA